MLIYVESNFLIWCPQKEKQNPTITVDKWVYIFNFSVNLSIYHYRIKSHQKRNLDRKEKHPNFDLLTSLPRGISLDRKSN